MASWNIQFNLSLKIKKKHIKNLYKINVLKTFGSLITRFRPLAQAGVRFFVIVFYKW